MSQPESSQSNQLNPAASEVLQEALRTKISTEIRHCARLRMENKGNERKSGEDLKG